MTLVLGYIATDGIVIAADRRTSAVLPDLSVIALREDTEKLSRVGAAWMGHTNNASGITWSVVESIQTAASRGKAQRSATAAAEVASGVARRFWRRWFSRQPAFFKPPEINFLIAGYDTPKGGGPPLPRLFCLHSEQAFAPSLENSGFTAIGWVDLARIESAGWMPAFHTTSEARDWALILFGKSARQTKTVGRSVRLVTIRPDGTHESELADF